MRDRARAAATERTVRHVATAPSCARVGQWRPRRALEVAGLDDAVRRPPRRQRSRLHRAARGDHGAHRPQRRRQDDGAQHAERLLPSDARASITLGPRLSLATRVPHRAQRRGANLSDVATLRLARRRRQCRAGAWAAAAWDRCSRRADFAQPHRGHKRTSLLAFCGYAGGLDARADDSAARRPAPGRDRARARRRSRMCCCWTSPPPACRRTTRCVWPIFCVRIADAGIGIVLVEHDMALVMRMCDHIVVLDAGQRLATGTPDRDPRAIPRCGKPISAKR